MIEAVNLLAQKEAILLDPVYSGKGFAGLIDLIRVVSDDETQLPLIKKRVIKLELES